MNSEGRFLSGNAGITNTQVFYRDIAEGASQGDIRAAFRHGESYAEANRGKEIITWTPD